MTKGKYCCCITVSGAGAPHDGMRCFEFGNEKDVMAGAESLVALQQAAIDHNKKAPKKGTKDVTITAVTHGPDGSLYHSLSLAYSKASDELVNAVAAAYAVHEAKHAQFKK